MNHCEKSTSQSSHNFFSRNSNELGLIVNDVNLKFKIQSKKSDPETLINFYDVIFALPTKNLHLANSNLTAENLEKE